MVSWNRSAILHIAVLMFGAGAWIAVNGVWVELPVLVQKLPEKWNLPSFLAIIAQVGNIGPLVITLMQVRKRIHLCLISMNNHRKLFLIILRKPKLCPT